MNAIIRKAELRDGASIVKAEQEITSEKMHVQSDR